MSDAFDTGTLVSHYRILGRIGAGGMGVVYLAEDERLRRKVALKFVSPAVSDDPIARERLLREARAVGALDHANIATVFEVGEHNGQLFIAMAYYAGETLRARLERGPLALEEALVVLGQIANGLAAAHAAGIVHRDLKPANIMLTESGQVKILDFGLAKDLVSRTTATSPMTETGMVLGTVAYMAPEQASGDHVDERADIWALGTVMFEALTGHLAFDAPSPTAVLLAAATRPAPKLRSLRAEAPKELEDLVAGALIADRNSRVVTAREIAATLEHLRSPVAPAPPSRLRRVASTPAGKAALATAAIVLLAGGYFVAGFAQRQWARGTALPEIALLADQQQLVAAFELASRTQRILGDDEELNRLWPRVSRRATIESEPAGATIAYRAYGSQDAFHAVGVTPLRDVRLPIGWLEFTAEKAGFDRAEDVTTGAPRFELTETGKSPEGMVRATASGPFSIYILGLETKREPVNAFWIDRYEVTNRQYKQFVDAGGYTDQKYWAHPFVRGATTLSWNDALKLFRDATGRPGPATWELGTYAAGHDDDPVTGVSWHEAAAYAAYRERQLPTVYHWYYAASQGLSVL